MTKQILFVLGLGLVGAASLAHADEIEYHCSGSYVSGKAANKLAPETVSVRATLDATMLGDESVDGSFTLESAKLVLTTADGKTDAGSITTTKELLGKLNDKARNPIYKNFIKFGLGSVAAPAYVNSGDQPETYLLLPYGTQNTVYVQRQGSGHDSYPTLRLTCEP